MEDPPASGPVSSAPRAFRGAELRQVLAEFAADDEGVPTPLLRPSATELDEAPSFALDLLAGAMTGEPVGRPPPAVRPGRGVPSGRRPRS